jgi:replication initiation protein RepC
MRDAFALSHRDIAALRSIISVLPAADPKDPAIIDTSGMLMVYASNATLMNRADGMNERTLRRAIAKLIEVGLVERVSSSSGKRFPLRMGGEVVAAFGLDLSPLFSRLEELEERAEGERIRNEEFRSLRSQLLADRKTWLDEAYDVGQNVRGWVEDLAKVLRRRLDLEQLKDIAQQAAEFMSSEKVNQPVSQSSLDDRGTVPCETGNDRVERHMSNELPPCPTSKLSASNGQSVRHNESPNIRNIKAQDLYETKPKIFNNPLNAYRASKHLKDFFPNEPRSMEDLQEMVFSMSSYLNLKNIAEAVASIGWFHLIRVLEYFCDMGDKIRSHSGYLKQILATATSNGVVLGQPVSPPVERVSL